MSPGIPVLPEKRLVFKLVNFVRNLESGRKTPRVETDTYCQELRFWPSNTSHANWNISPGIWVLTEKHLGPQLKNTARNFGSDRKTPSIQIGKNRQEFLFRISYSNWSIPPGILVLTAKHIARKLRKIARNFGSDSITHRVKTGKNRQGFRP